MPILPQKNAAVVGPRNLKQYLKHYGSFRGFEVSKFNPDVLNIPTDPNAIEEELIAAGFQKKVENNEI
jgi:hypothetical protein